MAFGAGAVTVFGRHARRSEQRGGLCNLEMHGGVAWTVVVVAWSLVVVVGWSGID